MALSALLGTLLQAGPTLELPDIIRSVATTPWPEDRGNHRALVMIETPSEACVVSIPWRRRDAAPEHKNVVVVSAQTGERISNVVPLSIAPSVGVIAFEPKDGPGEYEIYFMPYVPRGGSVEYATVYQEPEDTADPAWRERTAALYDAGTLPEAQVTEIQARRPSDRFDPMELVATPGEANALVQSHPAAPFLVFAEDRTRPIRMADALPRLWVEADEGRFEGRALRGEFYAWQIGVFASRAPLSELTVRFADLRGESGAVLSANAWRCTNLEGVDWRGRRFSRNVDVPVGRVQALWVGAMVPDDLPAGAYRGEFHVGAQGVPERPVAVTLHVAAEPVEEHGDTEPWRHSRLRWLDSTIALDDEVTAPYSPLRVEGPTVSCLGRSLEFAPTGLPRAITSFFADTVDEILPAGERILAAPMDFVVQTAGGEIAFDSQARITRRSPGKVGWQAMGHAGAVTLTCDALMEYDGHVAYDLLLEATEATDLTDVRLVIPVRERIARYLMGMGREGGTRPDRWHWTWDQNRHQDAVWIGDVNAGLRLRLRGSNYERPLVNIYYRFKPLNLPDSWHNGGAGGCTIEQTGFDRVTLTAYSGPRALQAGETLHFGFDLLVTPVKPLDHDHFQQRYYHAYGPIEDAAASGANVVNIHHANDINPYINYPFLTEDVLTDYVRAAHAKGLKLKVYYTVRELTNHATELWALRSLGHEVLASGPGTGDPWLTEHLGEDFMGAWRHPFPDGEVDAAILTSGMSRWHNYYLEGLDYLLRRMEIDGIYIDDVAYDRVVMQRVRKILDRRRPGSLIDLHSWNHFNDWARFATNAVLYMEHFPYVDSLWFGEGFDYNRSADYWLTEISGIPYGLFSELLQPPINPWRGLVYGMTARLPYSGDPRPIWKLWDDFGIDDARMIGYWSKACPVHTGRDDVLATAYVRDDAMLVAFASWAPETVQCRLSINWAALGLDPGNATITAPALEGYQDAAELTPGDPVTLEPGGGLVLRVGSREGAGRRTTR